MQREPVGVCLLLFTIFVSTVMACAMFTWERQTQSDLWDYHSLTYGLDPNRICRSGDSCKVHHGGQSSNVSTVCLSGQTRSQSCLLVWPIATVGPLLNSLSFLQILYPSPKTQIDTVCLSWWSPMTTFWHSNSVRKVKCAQKEESSSQTLQHCFCPLTNEILN